MRPFGVIAIAILLAGGNATAQEAAAPEVHDEDVQGGEEQNPLADLNWVIGPKSVKLAHATLNVPEGFLFLDQGETTRFQEIVQNPTSGRESLIAPDDLRWFGLFEFEDIGYVKDDEEIDAGELLDTLKEGNEHGNEERRKKGWAELHITGWRF